MPLNHCVACHKQLADDEAFIVGVVGPHAYEPEYLVCRACLFGDWGATLVSRVLDDCQALGDEGVPRAPHGIGVHYLRLDESEGGSDVCYPEDLCVIYPAALARAIKPLPN